MPGVAMSIKQSDVGSTVRFTASDLSGPVDLSQSDSNQIRFSVDGKLTKSAKFVGVGIVDPDQVANKGVFTYTWVAGNLDTPDILCVETTFHWPDGSERTFPSVGYLKIEVEPRLLA